MRLNRNILLNIIFIAGCSSEPNIFVMLTLDIMGFFYFCPYYCINPYNENHYYRRKAGLLMEKSINFKNICNLVRMTHYENNNIFFVYQLLESICNMYMIFQKYIESIRRT